MARKTGKIAVKKSKSQALPKRKDVPLADQWDLTVMFPSDAAWEKEFTAWEREIPKYEPFRGQLAKSAKTIAALLEFNAAFDRRAERLGIYAGLQSVGDNGDSIYQRMKGRFSHVEVKASEAASFVRPELLAIPPATMNKFLNAKELAPWKLMLERIIRYRKHTLTQHEEQLLAMSGQMSDGPSQIFRQLSDTDMKWPTIKDETGATVEVGHSVFQKCLYSSKRPVRKAAFHAYYTEFEAHKHTLAASYNASVQRDIFYSKARSYPSRASPRCSRTMFRLRFMTLSSLRCTSIFQPITVTSPSAGRL